MTNNLFTYGTLMYSDVMDPLCTQKYESTEATLKGYQRFHINYRQYPGLIQHPQSQVKGVIYFNINQKDLERLHSYENEYTPV